MKSLSKLLIILVLITIMLSCNNSVSPEFNDRFAIYLLNEDSLQTKDIEDLLISNLKLKSEPILTYNDITAYDFDNHKVFLKNNLFNFLGKDSIRVFSRIFGVPFILVSKGERIYLGSFITGLSSWVPNTPKIADLAVNNSEKSFLIASAPIYDPSTFKDERNDKRIFEELKDKLVNY
ncbi:MAG: hypothetical protein H6609_19660 [Ignavibacteriales bacterium]|nr:hypothetical protein [Ignavibacteriales bacterium]